MKKEGGSEIVILGAGAAGISAAREILSRGGKLTLISEESPPVYFRPLLPYYLSKRVERERLFAPAEILEKVHFIEKKKVVEIAPSKSIIRFMDGDELGFEKLLIATGGIPITPDIDGIEGEGVFFFNTCNEIDRLASFIDKGKVRRVAVIGGGFIGVGAAQALCQLGLEVTIIELLENLLPGMLDNESSMLAEKLLEMKGIRVLKGSSVSSIRRKDSAIKALILEDGFVLPCDMVIVSVGVRPNIPDFDGEGPAIHKGILVDEYLETSIKGIYAAGDVVESRNRISDEKIVIPNWTNAVEQGMVTGRNMLGERVVYEGGMVMNSIKIGGTNFISIGNVNPRNGDNLLEFVEKNPERRIYRKILTENGTVKGVILVGDLTFSGALNDLMKRGIYIGGLEEEISRVGKNFIQLLLESRRSQMEGDIEWPEEMGLRERFEKRVDEATWKRREE